MVVHTQSSHIGFFDFYLLDYASEFNFNFVFFLMQLLYAGLNNIVAEVLLNYVIFCSVCVCVCLIRLVPI